MIDRLYSKRVARPMLPTETVKDGHIVTDYLRRDDGSVKELDVDQFSGQPFMQNAQGWITNDIMAFEQTQSDGVARAILQRMKILHPQNAPQDITEDEMFSLVMPANYGSPAEFVSSQVNLVSSLNKVRSERAKAHAVSVQREL